MSEFNSLSGPLQHLRTANVQRYECRESLVEIIQQQILPRLLNAQQFLPASGNDAGYDAALDWQAEVLAFADFCIQGKADAADAIVDRLIGLGLGTDRIFLDLITPAARHLGVLWEQDRCDFTQVTCGLAQMHLTTYRIGYEFQAGPHAEGQIDRVMLACAPGSQHFLGLTIVADFFRKTGAEVVLEISSTENELLRAAANEWFDVIGLSVAIETQLPTLPSLVSQLRASSGNPQVRIVLGGPIFLIQDLRPEQLGADAISTDARDAVSLMKRTVRAKV